MDEPAAPGAGEILIDVAAGIGNWDELVRIGSWQIGGPGPFALGTEPAGTVAAAGPGIWHPTIGRSNKWPVTRPISSIRRMRSAAWSP